MAAQERQKTTYLQMVKPRYDEDADIQDINNNMDILDAAFHGVEGVIAPQFAQGTANAAETYVMYNGKVYYLPNGHTAGATWASTTKTQTNIGAQLKDIKNNAGAKIDDTAGSGVTNKVWSADKLAGAIAALLDVIAPQFVQATANSAGSYVTYNNALYYLPDGHTANTTWANTIVVHKDIGEVLQDLKINAGAQIDDTAGAGVTNKVWSTNKVTVELANLLKIVAPKFAPSAANAVGSYVVYDNELYQLPNGHTVGTTWANTTKTKQNIGDVLVYLKDNAGAQIDDVAGSGVTNKVWSANKVVSEMSNLLKIVASPFNQSTANEIDSYVVYENELYQLPEGHVSGVTWANTAKEKKDIGDVLVYLRDNAGAQIDDTAGYGDQDVVWSASKTEVSIDAAVDNTIAVQDTQPLSENNKIWMTETPPSGLVVPTYEEYSEAISELTNDLDDLETTVGTNPGEKNSTATGIDLDVSDENGNVIVRFKDGHIKTKNFDSENAGGGSEVKNSLASDVDLDISDPNGNVILRLKNGHIQTKNFNSMSVGSSVITVASSGADYTTVRGAVEAAQAAGASADNPYTIQISAGTYNILSEFTSEEIADTDFIGLLVTDGITLEGMGTLCEQTVLYAEMDTTTYDSTKRNKVATVNFTGNCGLKNLTVKSKNMRYAVHDDKGFTSSKKKIRMIENCKFLAESTTSGGYGNISYGAGTDGDKVFYFKNCDFSDLVHIHTNAGSKSNIVFMEGCKGFGFTTTDYASTVDNHYYFNDCVFQWISVEKGNNWSAQHLFIHGTVKDAMVAGWSGMQYELGDSIRYQNPNISAYPKAVAMETSGRQRIKVANTAESTIGVCYYYDSTNNMAFVQHGGYICAELLGFASPTVGHYLVVGSDGALSLDASNTNAIGKVVCVNNAGQHFIKLSI